MLEVLTRYWWAFIARGILAIALGVMVFAWPGITVTALIIVFGIYVFVDGIFLVVKAIGGWKARDDRWLLLFEGLLGIGIGVITFFAPGVTAVGLLFYIAAWSLADWHLGDCRGHPPSQGDPGGGMVDILRHCLNPFRRPPDDFSWHGDPGADLALGNLRLRVRRYPDCVGHQDSHASSREVARRPAQKLGAARCRSQLSHHHPARSGGRGTRRGLKRLPHGAAIDRLMSQEGLA